MTIVSYWIGEVLLAAVQRQRHEQRYSEPIAWYYNRQGGYRSLRFRLNSFAFHRRNG